MSGFADRIDAARATGPGNSGTPVASCAGPSCAQLWAAIHAERDRTLAIADPIARNRQISAQYAGLYRSNQNLGWVGLASVVSRQAGCAMVKADTARQSWIPMKSSPADSAFRALAEANGKIYQDIYPPAKFYQQYGLRRL